MWTTIIAFALKHFPWLDTVKTFVKGNFSWIKWVLLAIPFVVLLILLGMEKLSHASLKTDYANLQTEMVVLTTDLSNAKERITALESELRLKTTESTGINALLQSCYSSLASQNKDMQEINNNMIPKDTDTPLNQDTQGAQEYVPITKEQNAAGIHFVNRQLDAIK